MQSSFPQFQSIIKDTLSFYQSADGGGGAERRHYYIRVKDIKIIHPDLIKVPHQQQQQQKSSKLKKNANNFFMIQQATNQKEQYRITLSMSLKKTDTRFNIDSNNRITSDSREKLKRQAHMFCYDGEQIMTLILENCKQKANWDDHDDQQNKGVIGFAKVLLTPFITLPQTKHTITVNMVLKNHNCQISNQIAAVVKLKLYFLLEFKAKFYLTPVSADLSRNTATFGQMRPGLIIQINNQRQKSLIIDKGGIHPNWQQFSAKVRKSIEDQIQLIDSSQIKQKRDKSNKKIIVEEEHQDEKKVQEKRIYLEKLQEPQVKNQYEFDLTSVGHDLKIMAVNYPPIGQDATLIGQTIISMDQCNFFKNPKTVFPPNNGQNLIKLYYMDTDKTMKDAGTIGVRTQFDYDAEHIMNEIDSETSGSQDDEFDI